MTAGEKTVSGPSQSTQVNIHEAKTHLSKLIERVENGEEIVIARNGKPVAKLVPAQQLFPVKLGTLRGQIKILPGFDEADEEIARMFHEANEHDPLLQSPE